MAARVTGLTRLDHAVNGALLLSYACNRMEDRVGLVSFATDEAGRLYAVGYEGMIYELDFTEARFDAIKTE